MSELILIETASDLQAAGRTTPRGERHFLAVSAVGAHALMHAGISFYTEDHLVESEDLKRLGLDNYARLDQWTSAMDAAVQESFPCPSPLSFRPYSWHYYRTKILLDALTSRDLVLNNAIERFKPTTIRVRSGVAGSAIHDHDLFFNLGDSLYGTLIRANEARFTGAGIGVNFFPREELEKEPTSLEAGSAGRSFSRVGSSNRALFRRLERALATGALRQLFAKGPNVLLGSLGYDIDGLVNDLSCYLRFLRYLGPGKITTLLGRSLNAFDKGPRRNTEIHSIPLGILKTQDNVEAVFQQRMQAFSERYLDVLHSGLLSLKALDEKYEIQAYVHSSGSPDAMMAVPVAYFTDVKKPVVIVQHGGYGYAHNKITEYSEFAHDGVFLAWGDGVKEMYEPNKRGSCEILTTGSPAISRIKGGNAGQKIKRICYVPGTYRGYTAHFPTGQPCLDAQLYLLQRSVIDALALSSARFKIVYKPGPHSATNRLFGNEPIIDVIKERSLKIEVMIDPLPAVIDKFDLFIIDFPSTVLVQVAATNAEIILYNGNPYHQVISSACELLHDRAILANTETKFLEKIFEVLENGNKISDTSDRKFVHHFGTGSGPDSPQDNLDRAFLELIAHKSS